VERGSAPIKKNIAVTDEHGSHYEATYPKRAKGLVKHGRARFIDAHTICLARPPNILEESKMSDKANPKPEKNVEAPEFTLNWVMQKIDAIIHGDTEYLIAAEEGVALAREVTNQKMLDLLGRMYDDLKPKQQMSIEQIMQMAHHLPPGNLEKFLSGQL
jgi:hypothetical protein